MLAECKVYEEARTKKRVGIEPSDILDDISGMTVPMRHPSVCLNSVDESTTGILQRNSYPADQFGMQRK